jgi:hypothetical protein
MKQLLLAFALVLAVIGGAVTISAPATPSLCISGPSAASWQPAVEDGRFGPRHLAIVPAYCRFWTSEPTASGSVQRQYAS